eukprot:6578505-Pyramimonas_sp.AAC.1
MAILEADPYLTDEARAAFIPPPEPMLGLDDVDAEPYPPVQRERYPARMFLPDQYTDLAAQALPVAIKRAEYYVLNLFCGRRRPEDIQA